VLLLGGSTAIGRGMLTAQAQFDGAGAEDTPHVMIVFTDGSCVVLSVIHGQVKISKKVVLY
jgi:Mg-chelatase subunit ChlD